MQHRPDFLGELHAALYTRCAGKKVRVTEFRGLKNSDIAATEVKNAQESGRSRTDTPDIPADTQRVIASEMDGKNRSIYALCPVVRSK
jgi:hypothetical protein